MSSLEKGIINLLEADDQFMALVNALEPSYDLADDAKYPAVAFWRMNNTTPGTLNNYSSTCITLMQFRMFAHTKTQCRQIKNRIKAVLGAYIGTPTAGPYIQGIIVLDDREIPRQGTTLLRGWEQEFKIFWVEDDDDASTD